jgi:hypothetical protein
MRAGGAAGLRTPAHPSGKLPDVFTYEVRVIHGDGAIQQADYDFCATATDSHQFGKPNNTQWGSTSLNSRYQGTLDSQRWVPTFP